MAGVLELAGCGGGATIGPAPGVSVGSPTVAPNPAPAASPVPSSHPSASPGAAPSPQVSSPAAAPSPAASSAAGTPPGTGTATIVSGTSPFATAACATASGMPALGTAAEPQIASDPRDSKNVVVVWQQDRFNADGGAVSNVVAVSHDAGASFHEVLDAGLSLCTGGADQRVSDPWLSWGPDGTLYLASLTFSEMPQNAAIAGPTTLVVQRSVDAGESWSAPVAVQPFDTFYNDRESITADPTRPGQAYVVFVKRYGSQGESGFEQFSRTADGGKTWTAPATIYVPAPGLLTDPTLVGVLPNGDLLDVLIVANLTPFLPSAAPRVDWQIVSQRSSDRGTTWTNVANIATIYPAAPVDPQSGKIVRAYPVVSLAVAPTGTAYIAWNEIPTPTGPSTIRFAKSLDGGVSWSAPGIVKRSTGQAFLPSIAASATTLAVTYDDTRNDTGTGTSENFTTDVWQSVSDDGGATWRERHLAGPFDMATAPESDSAGVAGLFVGEATIKA